MRGGLALLTAQPQSNHLSANGRIFSDRGSILQQMSCTNRPFPIIN